jgi:hypothetical protein
MLVIDLMHEFELGVWKKLFTHLIHMLHALDLGTVIELDCRHVYLSLATVCFYQFDLDFRYHQLPTFGQDGICKFSSNSSEMKKMAARDFKDLLQVSFSELFL